MRFEDVLPSIRNGGRYKRSEWSGDKYITIRINDGVRINNLEIRIFKDGELYKSGPWVPTQCDLMEDDWVSV